MFACAKYLQRFADVRLEVRALFSVRLKCPALNLLRWRHLENNSARLFNDFFGSCSIMNSFSERHKLQHCVPVVRGLACFKIDHLMLNGFPPSLSVLSLIVGVLFNSWWLCCG